MGHNPSSRAIFDVLYGFIPITEWEEAIINSPFFQRLRWIKQLGFSNYIFPGAEHNRFAHAIGVMHSMDQMLEALGLSVPFHELQSRKTTHQRAMLHKSLRIAALLHDIGTFPFSHAIEYAYIRHGHDDRRPAGRQKNLPNSHEHLGSFIIKNTAYEGGITQILEKYGFDVQLISRIIKGESPYLIANQLMHSDLDADRMDYLIRDAHYTGIRYGQFDRDYILASLQTFSLPKGQLGYGIRETAVHAIEDFLIARYHWYSQVIRNPGSAKFDILSSHVAKSFLEKDLMYQFHDLLSMVEKRGERFFWWNDTYFITRCQEVRYHELLKDPRVSEWIEMLLYRKSPKTLNHPLFQAQLLSDSDNEFAKTKRIEKIEKIVREYENLIKKQGSPKDWILLDIPQKDVVFTSGMKKILRRRTRDNLYEERDPIKIVQRDGKPMFLVEYENSLMNKLAGFSNFVPSVYVSDGAYKKLAPLIRK